MKKYYLASLAFLSVAAASAHAQLTFDRAPTANSVYYGAYNRSGDYEAAESRIVYEVGGGVAFNYNFSAPGADTLQVTLSAPEGKQFVLTAPVGYEAGLEFYFGHGFASTNYAPSVAVDFRGFNGTLGSTGTSSGFSDSNGSFSFQASLGWSPGTTISFLSITLTTVLPDGFTGSFDDTAAYRLTGSAFAYSDVGAPGEWFRLEDVGGGGGGAAVPEPSTYAAIAGGAALGLAAWKRRRRAAMSAT